MLASRAFGILLVMLSPGCFSPSEGGTQSTSNAGTTTTGTSTSTTSPSTASTSTSPESTSTSTSPTTSTTSSPTTGLVTSTEPVTSTTDGTTTTTLTTTSTTGTTELETSTSSTSSTSSTTIDPGFCGDGNIDLNLEQCDDGNDNDHDDCTNSCLIAFCGDGVVHEGVEECDEDGSNCEQCLRLWMQVFVSSQVLSADLDGLTGADAKCQSLADGAGLKGQFKAWLSTDKKSASARLIHSDRPYKRVDAVQIASNWNDLVDGSLAAPININENGDEVGQSEGCGVCPVWAATNTQGGGQTDDCTDWNSPLILNTAPGECTLADSRWTAGCAGKTCNEMAHIYCFEQGLTP